MNLQTLSAFVAVAREGSLTRAAEKLHITQPAVGLHIRNLQSQTGLVLFKRTAQGMKLTPDGSALLPLAEKVLHSQASFRTAAHHLRGEIRGRLRLGTILDPEFLRLGALLRELLGYTRHLEISLSHGMSGETLQRLMRDELDAGFYLSIPGDKHFPGESVHGVVLSAFTYQVVAPAGWNTVATADWAQLAGLPWLATPPASAHQRLLAQVFGQGSITGMSANYVAMVDQEASMLDLVKSGVGLSLVRDHIALRAAQAHGLVIAQSVSLPCALSFICLRTRVADPSVAAALAALEQAWPNVK